MLAGVVLMWQLSSLKQLSWLLSRVWLNVNLGFVLMYEGLKPPYVDNTYNVLPTTQILYMGKYIICNIIHRCSITLGLQVITFTNVHSYGRQRVV